MLGEYGVLEPQASSTCSSDALPKLDGPDAGRSEGFVVSEEGCGTIWRGREKGAAVQVGRTGVAQKSGKMLVKLSVFESRQLPRQYVSAGARIMEY